MDRKSELAIVRRVYAKQVMAAAGVTGRRLEAAFATIRREDFLGRGPWQVVRWGRGYAQTPTADPVYLYDDVVVAILPERNLNNGQPSLHAALLAAAAPQPGDHAVHIGTGAGYYTAVLAHMVGRRGRVTGIEYDAELAARTAANLRNVPHATIAHGDGNRAAFDLADVIYVNAGATGPADCWLDGLRQGGRLILALTDAGFPNGDSRRGAVFRIEKDGDAFSARRVSGVAIFPCAGGRDLETEAALAEAFRSGGAERVTRLYRRTEISADDCWVRGKGWCLAYR